MSLNGKSSTRVSQQPDWMVSGLLKAALFPDQAPDQPMFNTGVTYAELRDQIRAILGRSGLKLTTRELSSGTHWLTERVANQVSDSDTKESLISKLNDFVAQYVIDKSIQRATGVSQRSPIYTREWYDKNFTPPTDREAAGVGSAEDSVKPEPSRPEPAEMVYVGLDGDDMGHLVEDSLLSDDPEIAARISNSIHDAHRAIRKLVASVGGSLIFDGGDNMLFIMPNEPEVFETIREIHQRTTKHSVTIGVGRRPIEAHYALVVGKNTGKDKVVVYDEKVRAQQETIRSEQGKLEDAQNKLKYRASALQQVEDEPNVADRLRQVLSSQGLDASDSAVHDLFWRLVQQFDLNDMRAIALFFAAADDNDMVSALRQTYAKRMDWSLRAAKAKDLTKSDGVALCNSLVRAIEAGNAVAPKFAELVKAVDDQTLKDLDEASTIVGKRFNLVATEFAEMFKDEKVVRHSHYVEEANTVAGEIASMQVPIDQVLTTALKSVGNAQAAGNTSIDVAAVVKIVTHWVERVNTLAMVLDLVCIVGGARPMEMVAADMGQAPTSFPGQTNVVRGPGQKSPHARHDWLTVEDYNQDVDWRKTDDQAGLSLPGEFSERSVGGDAGGSPIYVP